jgi:trans-4-hydroxy-L-proline dehydratase
MDTEALLELGEPFAAGVYERPDQTMVERFARGLWRWAEYVELPAYAGEMLYPTGPCLWAGDLAVGWHYVAARPLDRQVLDRKLAAADQRGRQALLELAQAWSAHRFPGGYTHSIPHYERLLREGLDGYAARVQRGLSQAGQQEPAGFFRALQTTLEAARVLHRRIVAQLQQPAGADGDADLIRTQRRQMLLEAYRRVPFAPAASFIEAAVATNFLFYLDGCDDLGRYDQYLGPYLDRDLDAGILARQTAVDLVRAQWRNVDDASAWNAAIGGTRTDGTDLSNRLTVVCLEAAQGCRRPNLALRLGESTPDEVWDAALDTISGGNGLPALYWDPSYFRAMDVSGIPVPDSDQHEYAFGGCTELMVQGRSFVGSLDADVNLPAVLTRCVTERLPSAPTFQAFYAAFCAEVELAVEGMARTVNAWQREKAVWQPQPIRSLLIDDCIERGVEYSAGGARYNWSVINVVGLANAIDSLCAIREVVFGGGQVSGAELVAALAADFAGAQVLRHRLARAPRYGNGHPLADRLAREFSAFVFEQLLHRRCWRGGPFVPACLMFTTYAWYGEPVGATPDGRRAGEPVADSAGPYQGRDVSGPTAMLQSTASLDQQHAPGTLVVNLRLGRSHFTDPLQRDRTKALIRSYFEQGGLQLQVNVIDQRLLEEAVRQPEKHGDLIIRVGGYSEYWSRLTPQLRQSILLRTEH